MFGIFKKRAEEKRLRADWRLVATLEASVQWNNKKDNDGKLATDTIYYYLRENGLGERKCHYKGTGELAKGLVYNVEWAQTTMKSHSFYLEKIQPWLYGAADPDIPTYSTIKAKEFKDSLKGEKT